MCEETKSAESLPRQVIDASGRMGLLAILVLSAAAFTGRWLFWGDVCSHFVHFYLCAAIVGFVLMLPQRKPRWLALALILIAVNGLRVAPLYVSAPVAHASVETQAIRVVSVNIYCENPDDTDLIAWLQGVGPDILCIQEVDADRLAAIEAALPELAHGIRNPSPDALGMVILSRFPVVESFRDYFAEFGIVTPSVTLDVNGTRLRVTNLHTIPAVDFGTLVRRNEMLDGGAARATETGGPGILIGDLNCGPWSPGFRAMKHAFGLLESRRGFGIHGTWTAQTRPFTTPIDHILHTPDILTDRFYTGPAVGSDHLPIVADLLIPAAEG